MRFFLDNCLSPRFAKGLGALSERDGHEAFHLSDKFSRDEDDEIWLPALGAEGDWVIVSGDTRIIRSATLRRAWVKTQLTGFFLSSGWMNVDYWTQAVLLVRWWPSILTQAELVEAGSGFEVPYRNPGRFKPIIAPP